MFVLNFEGEQGSERFEICYQAIVLNDRRVEVAEWDEVISLLKKLKQAGKASKKTPNGIMLYDLADGKTVILERAERKLLLDFIERPIWIPGVLEQVQDTRDWLKNTPETPAEVPSGK